MDPSARKYVPAIDLLDSPLGICGNLSGVGGRRSGSKIERSGGVTFRSKCGARFVTS